MTNLIALCGYARTGKDTVADILATVGWAKSAFRLGIDHFLLAQNPLVQIDGFHQPMPLQQAVGLLGWEGCKASAGFVELMQRTGDEASKPLFGEDCWARYALGKAGERTVFTSCRFPEEADALRKQGGVVWRVNRHGVGPRNDHPSEIAMDRYHVDWHIWNNGTIEQLRAQVLDLVR